MLTRIFFSQSGFSKCGGTSVLAKAESRLRSVPALFSAVVVSSMRMVTRSPAARALTALTRLPERTVHSDCAMAGAAHTTIAAHTAAPRTTVLERNTDRALILDSSHHFATRGRVQHADGRPVGAVLDGDAARHDLEVRAFDDDGDDAAPADDQRRRHGLRGHHLARCQRPRDLASDDVVGIVHGVDRQPAQRAT